MTEEALEARLDQAKRDEEWALVRVGGWVVLLLVILVVLLISPWPWGALVGLLFWGLGFRGVLRDLSQAVGRTKELRDRAEQQS